MYMTLKKRRIILCICVLIFLALAPAVVLYSYGYRFDKDFHLIKTGGLYLYSPLAGSQIFINNELKKETNILQKGFFLQNLKPNSYSIIIAKEGCWPWAKELEVKEQLVTEARALLLPKEPNGEIIRPENTLPSEIEKYNEITLALEELRMQFLKSHFFERFSNNGKQKIWWNAKENKIWVEWLGGKESLPYYFNNEEKVVVLESRSPVRNVEFYPGRRDVLVIAVQNGIFAIEIDSRSNRNLQPIYKGKEPIFTIYKNEPFVYILEEKILIKIKLE